MRDRKRDTERRTELRMVIAELSSALELARQWFVSVGADGAPLHDIEKALVTGQREAKDFLCPSCHLLSGGLLLRGRCSFCGPRKPNEVRHG